jgi:hypothetical protein
MTANQQPRQSKGFMGWLGRQVAYVKHALETDVTAPAERGIVYRSTDVQQQPHPQDPNLTLRRTTIDEVILTPNDAAQFPKPPLTGGTDNTQRATSH